MSLSSPSSRRRRERGGRSEMRVLESTHFDIAILGVLGLGMIPWSASRPQILET